LHLRQLKLKLMRIRILLFLTLTTFLHILPVTHFSVRAQTPMKSYNSEWKKIDTLVLKQGLTKSALTAVNNIYNVATKEGNETQVLKALIYQVMLEEALSDNNHVDGIHKLEKHLPLLKGPAKVVLNNIIASRYWAYFQENRWKFYNRTATNAFKKDDPETWAPEDFHNAISRYYFASLKNEKQLFETSLAPFDAILMKGNMRKLRPTLYDLLAHRALLYFKNDERTITIPADAFELRNDTVFAPAETFVKTPVINSDTLSPYYSAIVIYRRLLALHLKDEVKDALLDADIDRLGFVHTHAVMPEKEFLYANALKSITDKYGDLPAASQAWFLQAEIHAENARTYQALTNERHRFEWIKAKVICDRLISQKDSTEGKINALNLLNEINTKSIFVHLETVNLPGKPFRALVTFKNTTKLYFRIAKSNDDINIAAGDVEQDKLWPILLALPVVKTFEQEFPDTKDYQLHATEIKIDPLPVGTYVLIASTTADFAPGKDVLAVHDVYVSTIAWIRKADHFFVVNRETGQPINMAR